MNQITLSVKKASLVFSAAHFLSGFGKCDRLHGHNYITEFKFRGKIDEETGTLIDFNIIKEELLKIIERLDHKIILPKNSKLMIITENKLEYLISINSKKYIFPKKDCILLEIPFTTCEWLSKFFFEKIKTIFPQFEIQVTIEETIGSKSIFGDW